MNIKLIVTDMDGTLLNTKDLISPQTRDKLIACQKAGIRLILASGRSYARLLSYADELQMKQYDGWLIEVNGMALYDLQTGERQIFKQLKRSEIDPIFTWLQEQEVEVQGMEDKALYYWYPQQMTVLKEAERRKRGLPDSYPWVGGAWSWVADSRQGYPKQIEITSAKDLPPVLNKLNCLAEPEKIREIQQQAAEKYGKQFEFCRTCPRLLEISPKGISKGQTLKRYMEKYHIQADEILAFGDGENDLDTFRQVKYSIAMENAEDFIKAEAFAVTGSNYADGVVRALDQFLPEINS